MFVLSVCCVLSSCVWGWWHWYVWRLRDETVVCRIIEDLENYLQLQRQATDDEICRVYLKRIQHLYYKVCWSLLMTGRETIKWLKSQMLWLYIIYTCVKLCWKRMCMYCITFTFVTLIIRSQFTHVKKLNWYNCCIVSSKFATQTRAGYCLLTTNIKVPPSPLQHFAIGVALVLTFVINNSTERLSVIFSVTHKADGNLALLLLTDSKPLVQAVQHFSTHIF